MGRRIFNTTLTILILSSALFILTGSVYADFGDTTLKKGINHPDVKVLQEKLSILGYFENEEFTDYFGDKTLSAVKAFQRDTALEQNGIVGKNTFKLLDIKIKQSEIISENFVTLKERDSGNTVKNIQTKLKTLEIYLGGINGSFDTATKEAVKKFQAMEGIPDSGEVDRETIIKLTTASNNIIASRASASRKIINAQVVDYAKKFLGVPYRWGASSGKAFDCSGFSTYIMKKFNVSLERTASGQFNNGTKVGKDDLQPGDLVFFTTYKKGPSHVGIFIGNNKFIHASSSTRQVTISDLGTGYYSRRYLGARRYELTLNH